MPASTAALVRRSARRWPIGFSLIAAAMASLGLWVLIGMAVLRLF